MKTRDVFGYSFSAIKLRKLRAGLTVLGVVIGIAAIVALLSITQGFQTTITGQLQKGFAADTLVVSTNTGSGGGFGPGGGGGFGGGAGGSRTIASSGFKLYLNYTNEITALSPDIVASFAVIEQPGYIKNSNGSILELNGMMTGINFSQYQSIYSTTFLAASGSIPTSPSDNDIVIGARVSDLRLNGTTFVNSGDEVTLMYTNATSLPFVNETYTAHVSAVLAKIGGFNLGGPSDTGVYIPISKAQSFFGTDQASTIIVKLGSIDNATIQGVSKLITDHFANQVTVTSSSAVIDQINIIFSYVNILLLGIAAISLLVAGVGIMNIMIVSLIERTREIGILKALGMKSRTVLAIFLCESVIIGLIGGLVGIVLGWVLGNVVIRVISSGAAFGGSGGGALNIVPILTPELILLALSFGIGVSVIFALYPAWRASKLKPVDALRYE
jgi:putative ABC transport system permease protein